MSRLRIDYRNIEELVPRSSNPRTHSEKQIGQIAASIKRFGFTNPVLIHDGDGIIAGHGRVVAAKRLGMHEVPTVRLSDMSEVEIRAYVIADNRLAENAGWDETLLGIEFAYLSELDLDFDLSITGFELPAIDLLIEGVDAGDDKGDEADAVPEVASGPAVTQPGDIWIIGPHRLICGDALDASTYARLLGEARAQMVFCDPPYNVAVNGHVSGLGKHRHREFAMASGEMSREAFTAFLTRAFEQLVAFSADGSLHYVCMDWRHMAETMAAGEAAYTDFKNLCVWAKTNGGMGSLYRSAHELVFVFKAGTAPHINNVELGRHGRNRTNVWSYAGANSFGASRDTDLAMHPTVKPVALVADAILDASHRGSIIVDAYAGSGTTLVAAERTGRKGRGIEIDPAYCDVIVTRMEQLFGLAATLEATGESFAQITQHRQPQDEKGGIAA
ncbi:MAG: DNA methyltransferase [Sphingobium sp.]|nr:ParB N-terminal domain-containing protein [Sphingobium sp.]MCP5400287.1 ParB N-terminal domain-containing protein [Sphingomonas sp.]